MSTKLQADYEPHDSYDVNEGWTAIREHVEDALLIAFDGCHKIYIAMDEVQARWFRDSYNGHDCDDRTFVGSPDEMFDQLAEWYEGSCSLRFISAVWTDVDDPNAGYVHLIEQFARDPRNEDDE